MSASRTRIRASSRRRAGQAAATASGATQADGDEREADAEQVDDQRREQAAGRDPERQDRLEAREHPREDGLVGEPGEQREAADVDQRVADPDHARAGRSPPPARGRRRSGRAARRTARCRRRTSRRAGPAGRCANAKIEPSTPPAPIAALRTPTPGSPVSRRSIATTTVNTIRQPRVNVCTRPSAVISAEPAIARDGGEAAQQLAAAAAGGLRPRRRVVRERDDDQRGQQRRGGARGEDRGRAARGEQDGRGERPAERRERVQHAAHGVRARQLAAGTWPARAAAPSAPAGRASWRPWRRRRAPYVAAAGPVGDRDHGDGAQRRRRGRRPTQASTRSRRTRSAIVASNGASSAADAMRAAVTAPTAATPPSRNATTPSATMKALSPAHIAPNETWARSSGPLRATWRRRAHPFAEPTRHGATIAEREKPRFCGAFPYAPKRTRTSTRLSRTRPSTWRVYQFRHRREGSRSIAGAQCSETSSVSAPSGSSW